MKYNTVLSQDDAAPDSKKYFDKKLLKITGFDINFFSNNGISKASSEDDYIQYDYDKWSIIIHADDPYWKLRSIEL